MSQGKLFLIPTYLSTDNDASFVSPMVTEVLQNTKHFFVENVRTARRFISSLKAGITIDELEFNILDKKSNWDQMYPLFEPLRNGEDMGVISEAGVPCLADPGNLAVSFAHQTNIQVVPMPGTSSIQMALIASGFNGQKFTFHGYLPIDRNPRQQKIRELEKLSQSGYTQLFMETPYRNQQLIKDILKTCRPDTLLSIAADISGSTEKILTQPVSKWQKTDIQIHKIPAIFSFGQFP
ncbi:16S rRNA (cytidine1402-2'-O)-methyltransferase [Ekhidna lutea]|uniref:16S rRNA (Cytidine1402-2'-O)-methyltransferase n=1 Tax=Ekhidna lutea TaxID=447679 RepID=A0A239EL19_EKHLU|nr:SAM-dependent methyltransferase [Ekhidna lutea]SNS44968.1 16S rRNA (cytidine1402-2'-O)-methyltransferase [Ekhidna lutea]